MKQHFHWSLERKLLTWNRIGHQQTCWWQESSRHDAKHLAKLTNTSSGGGVEGTQWGFVTCPIPKYYSVLIHMHGRLSHYWSAATVENARRETQSLEFSDAEGKTWIGETRYSDNFFVAVTIPCSGTAWVEVTLHIGTMVCVEDVSSGQVYKTTTKYVQSDDRTQLPGQFPIVGYVRDKVIYIDCKREWFLPFLYNYFLPFHKCTWA